jgi:hypothetical protein
MMTQERNASHRNNNAVLNHNDRCDLAVNRRDDNNAQGRRVEHRLL